LAIVPPSAISLPTTATLYYIGDRDGDVYARDLGHDETRKLCQLTPSENRDWLFLRESRVAAGRWDLIVGPDPLAEQPDPNPADRIVAASLTCSVAEPPSASLLPGGEVPRSRADQSGWQFHFGWMAGRLHGENATNGRNVLVSLETPFLRWPVYCPAQLPSGQVIFQLGGNQICILDPDERKVALLAKGRWPVMTLKESTK